MGGWEYAWPCFEATGRAALAPSTGLRTCAMQRLPSTSSRGVQCTAPCSSMPCERADGQLRQFALSHRCCRG